MATINTIYRFKPVDDIQFVEGNKPYYGWAEVNIPISRISYYVNNRKVSEMKNWCKDNVGEKAKDWTFFHSPNNIIFKFKNAADATLFSLKFSNGQ